MKTAATKAKTFVFGNLALNKFQSFVVINKGVKE